MSQAIINLWHKNGNYDAGKKTNYDAGNETIYNPEVLKYNLCDYNNVYILVRGNLTVIGHNVNSSSIQ